MTINLNIFKITSEFFEETPPAQNAYVPLADNPVYLFPPTYPSFSIPDGLIVQSPITALFVTNVGAPEEALLIISVVQLPLESYAKIPSLLKNT